MKVLVTGGGGFLGGALVRRLLRRGDEVAILGRSPRPDLESRKIKLWRGDIADAAFLSRACRGVEAVFHVAGKVGVWGEWEHFFNTNVLGTRNLLAACRENEISRLVYTSTPSVVFNRGSFRGADETLPYGRNWLCHYAHSKAIAEKEVLAANQPCGLRTIALRPHLIWGVGDPHLVPRILENARRGRLRIIGRGNNRVDITHVENAAAAHLLALDAIDSGKAAGRAFFLSQGEPVYLWEWINTLLAPLNLPMVKKTLSLPAAYAAGAILETLFHCFRLEREPPLTRFVALQLAKDHFFNISAARRDLGYIPKISTEEGMKELIAHLGKG